MASGIWQMASVTIQLLRKWVMWRQRKLILEILGTPLLANMDEYPEREKKQPPPLAIVLELFVTHFQTMKFLNFGKISNI